MNQLILAVSCGEHFRGPRYLLANDLNSLSFSLAFFPWLFPCPARPSSNHPGTVVAAILDGPTKSIDEPIDYHVYQALMTPQTRESDVPNNLYLLKEDDYLQ
jgi:hypothetical protein